MADITVNSNFNPNPLSNGGTFIQGWQDYQNDNGSVSNSIFRLPGQTFVSGLIAGGTWQRSARSSQTVSGVFTVVLRLPFTIYGYIGLNTGVAATYPATRYARSPYVWTTQTVATTGQVSRVFELGVNKGSNRNWGASVSLCLAICDTGSAIVYKYSEDNGVTWLTHYTSLAAYVPNQVYRVDVGTVIGNQPVMVEVYPSVL